VDWERTLSATWNERPHEPPLELHTRQRRRDFATPENLLTVATLLDYRADVQRLLWDEAVALGEHALRHPLNEIVTRCERELAFPQFASLRHDAQQIREGANGGIAHLEAQVSDRLLPGGNSAYEELLIWRHQYRTLRLLQRDQPPEPADTLGADPRRDNYLYQLWIFYELVDLLAEQGGLDALNTTPGTMQMQFRWGAEAHTCSYELRHDRAVPDPVGCWHASRATAPVPGVRPDFYLRRVDPPLERVQQHGEMFWREPGEVWDAKYYRERDQEGAPSPPVKRMLADLTLLGEPYGVLLFALLTGPADEKTGTGMSGYHLAPMPGHDQTITPDQRVAIQQLLPESDVRAILTALLDDTHARLHSPRVPACHGIFLDSLSAAEQTTLRDRAGAALAGGADDLLLCPKPHIGPWRVDLVSRAQHCCQDGHLCHIVGRPDSRKPVRPPRSAEELLNELQQMFEGDEGEALDDTTVQAIAHRVEGITRRFAEIAGVYRRIEVYTNRLRDMGLHRTLDLLGRAEQESLALALFLVEQLDSIGAQDYSAPAIHVSSVLEIENRTRVFQCPDLLGFGAQPKQQTLGTLPGMRQRRSTDADAQHNWQQITTYAARHWQGAVLPDEPDEVLLFDDYVKQLDEIAQMRNKAAHTHPVARDSYARLFRITCQAGRLKIGALNALLLAWDAAGD
jgi:hypothetical protein